VSYQQWQDAWRETLAVNLTGAANVTWCAVQYMKETGGRIVNVTSAARTAASRGTRPTGRARPP
jgi:hypothetical protein